jgi:two-component system, NtrC family, nitrogen regulation sensor histidine kinase GlnL
MTNRKYSYYFCVDRNLCISSWGKEIAHFTGKTSPLALNKKYYEVFPRIWMNGKDIVEKSLQDNKASILNGHTFCCLYGQSKADIKIDPLRDVRGKVIGAKISVYRYPTCPGVIALDDSQQFINIGKQATIFAHRIRNPLNAIKGAVVYLREKYHKDQVLREFTDIMKDEIAKLDSSISKFLGASLSDMEMAESDINPILKKIEIITSLQTNARKIKSSYAYRKVPPVKIDSFQFEQAILNVINNALEAMPHGGELKVSSKTTKRLGKKWVVLEISDTGDGICKNKKSDSSTASAHEGRGFGLFISREVLQYFRGDMEIKSKRGSGTTVKMYLPAM